MVAVVEGAGVQPGAIDGSANAISFVGCQESAAFVVVLPFLEGVNVTPLLRYAPVVYDLLQQCEREGD